MCRLISIETLTDTLQYVVSRMAKLSLTSPHAQSLAFGNLCLAPKATLKISPEFLYS